MNNSISKIISDFMKPFPSIFPKIGYEQKKTEKEPITYTVNLFDKENPEKRIIIFKITEDPKNPSKILIYFWNKEPWNCTVDLLKGTLNNFFKGKTNKSDNRIDILGNGIHKIILDAFPNYTYNAK